MSVLSDKWIKKMVKSHKIISPFIRTSGAVSLRTLIIVFPSVDFPDPDSPTMPIV